MAQAPPGTVTFENADVEAATPAPPNERSSVASHLALAPDSSVSSTVLAPDQVPPVVHKDPVSICQSLGNADSAALPTASSASSGLSLSFSQVSSSWWAP